MMPAPLSSSYNLQITLKNSLPLPSIYTYYLLINIKAAVGVRFASGPPSVFVAKASKTTTYVFPSIINDTGATINLASAMTNNII
jgi:hypothetical protein